MVGEMVYNHHCVKLTHKGNVAFYVLLTSKVRAGCFSGERYKRVFIFEGMIGSVSIIEFRVNRGIK